MMYYTKDYAFYVDEEAKIEINDYFLNPNFTLRECDSLNKTRYGNIQDKHNHTWVLNMCKGKVIAYYPRTEKAKDLDLPLLPNISFGKTDVEKLAITRYHSGYVPNNAADAYVQAFKAGYKEAQKEFNLENIKKNIEMVREDNGSDCEGSYLYSEEEIIESLFIQRLPKEFIPEWQQTPSSIFRENDVPYTVVKTIVNPKGKIELVGTYKYE